MQRTGAGTSGQTVPDVATVHYAPEASLLLSVPALFVPQRPQRGQLSVVHQILADPAMSASISCKWRNTAVTQCLLRKSDLQEIVPAECCQTHIKKKHKNTKK